MSTRTLISNFGRLVLAATLLVSSSACGGDLLRTGRSPVYLVVDRVEGTPGGGGEVGSFLMSDVRADDGSVFNDSVSVTIRSVAKNPSATASQINGVTLTRYRVNFRRADGRNVPGVDVPYSIDGAVSVTIPPDGTGVAAFEIVRHQAKLEPPLKNLDGFSASGRSLSGLGFISAIAEIVIYGRDGNGNEVSVDARIDVHFGDFSFE